MAKMCGFHDQSVTFPMTYRVTLDGAQGIWNLLAIHVDHPQWPYVLADYCDLVFGLNKTVVKLVHESAHGRCAPALDAALHTGTLLRVIESIVAAKILEVG